MEQALKIRYLRLKYHISLQELAAAAHTTHQLISRIELAQESPAKYHLALLQRGLEEVIKRREAENRRLAEEFSASRLALLEIVEVDI